MRSIRFLMIIMMISGCMWNSQSKKTGLEGKPLPKFNILLMDGVTIFNTKDIPNDKPVVVYLFSPYCPYCKAETRDMIVHMSSLNNIRFYMLSSFPLESVKKYCEDFRLYKYSNITVGLDTALFYKNYVKAIGMPYLAIYGKDKCLKRTVLGKINIEKVRDIAFE
jgi:thiol-disulfide isomerase/thioredoxin